jgi:hypothetical protein
MIFFPEIKTFFQKSQKCAIKFFMVIFVGGPPSLDTLTPSRYATEWEARPPMVSPFNHPEPPSQSPLHNANIGRKMKFRREV